MFNLSFHCNGEKNDEVNEQNGPEYWNIKSVKKSAKESYDDSTCSRIPREPKKKKKKVKENGINNKIK